MHLRSGLVPLALLCCALPFHAQSVSGEGQAPAATFKAETRAVAVDVVVLDGHGEPVKGLRKEDFLITEDGSPQTVTFFEEHPTATSQPDTVFSVLLIDTLNTPKEDLGFARKHVADYLKNMPAGTSLAVFSLGQTLRMVQGLSSDRSMLLAAVNDKKTGAWSETSAASNMPQDAADDKARTELLSSAGAPPNSAAMVNNAQAIHKTYQADQRIAMTIADLQRLARYLAKTPGRKNLIWFSSSFPIALFPEPGVQGSLTTAAQNQQIKDTTDLLALARVAIDPVSAQGVAVQTTGDASDHYGTAQNALPGAMPGAAPPAGTSPQSTGGDNYQYGPVSNEMRHEDNAHAANFAAMQALASETGGVMMPTSNDLTRMLGRAIGNGSQYYTLSYTPTNMKTDGSFRRIEVTLHNGSYTLAYRRGYYATDTILGRERGATPTPPTPKTSIAAVPQHTEEAPSSRPAQAPVSVAASAPVAVAGTSSDAPGLVHRTPEAVKEKAERRIHLDVVVTDAAGHVVSGLRQPDFTVLDKSLSEPIQSFRAVDGLAAEPPVEIVLILDAMNTSFQQVAAVRQGVEKFLRQNGGRLALPVSVVFLTDTGVKANHATRDGNALAADIEKLPAPSHVINSAQGLDGLMLRFGRSVDALTQITKYEATKPGRKLMIWVGEGWPMLSSARFHMDTRNQSSFFHSIVDLSTSLREARVTLYGVIPQDMDKGIEARAFMYQNFLKGVETAKQADAGNLSLQVLAEQSGGRALGPTGDIYGDIVRCAADANAYYELSFDSAAADRVDVYHGLEVKLNRPGLRVRTNTGYYAQP